MVWKELIIFAGLAGALPTVASGQAAPDQPTLQTKSSSAVTTQKQTPSNWWSEWDGFVEVGLRPTLGKAISDAPEQPWIDESEYDALIRVRRPIDRLRGIRLQLQAGATSAPNSFDSDEAESGLYAEAQLGDTYIPFSEFRRADFRRSAEATRANAVRPYVRFRYTRVYDGWIEDFDRHDDRGTIGLRYRRVPHLVERTYTEDGKPQPMQILPGFYFDARAELSRVWSSDDQEELWNPRFQLDAYSLPFLSGTRVLIRATTEKNFYEEALAPSGKRRVDTRLRLTAGLDISDSIEDLLDIPENALQIELLGRYQARWSNDPNREHDRWYLVPSVGLTIPLQ